MPRVLDADFTAYMLTMLPSLVRVSAAWRVQHAEHLVPVFAPLLQLTALRSVELDGCDMFEKPYIALCGNLGLCNQRRQLSRVELPALIALDSSMPAEHAVCCMLRGCTALRHLSYNACYLSLIHI